MSQGKKNKNEKRRGRILTWYHDEPVPEIPNANYGTSIIDLMTQRGNDIALVNANTDTSYTYAELREKILKLRDGFASSGVGLGDAVILICKNNMDFPVVLIALMLLGATCVPINPNSTKDELTHMVRVSQARWAVTGSKIRKKLEEAFAPLGQGFLQGMWIMDDNTGISPSLTDLLNSNNSGAAPVDEIRDLDHARVTAAMLFSSGTTGLPKGVMLSHRNLLTVYMQNRYITDINPVKGFNLYECTLLFVPMYHTYGFHTTLQCLSTGGKLVIRDRFSPEEYFQTIEKYKVTYSPIVPHIAKFLIETPLMEKYDLSSLFVFLTGSSPITEETLEALTEKSGKVSVNAYAMTETCATVSVNAGVAGSKPNSVGRVYPYIEAKIIDLETGEMVPEGEEGELCVRGPGITLGYANNAKATAETIDSGGWLHTGDLFYYDEDNFLFITDRIKDLIKVKGYQVAPTEIENILLELDEVAEVAVAGVPNDRLGEAPRAFIIPTTGASINHKKIMKHVADRLISYKQLAGGVEVVQSIPKNHLGKILRRQLKQNYLKMQSKL